MDKIITKDLYNISVILKENNISYTKIIKLVDDEYNVLFSDNYLKISNEEKQEYFRFRDVLNKHRDENNELIFNYKSNGYGSGLVIRANSL